MIATNQDNKPIRNMPSNFSFNTKVKIVSGFYKGYIGHIQDLHLEKEKYNGVFIDKLFYHVKLKDGKIINCIKEELKETWF